MSDSEAVRLKGPSAMRALAHPARLTVVDELYQGNERTASELAELTGLTASAMSYHLRALEKHGIVQRAEPRDDGRERPWRAPATTLSWGAEESDEANAAKAVIESGYLEMLGDSLRRWALAETRETEGWQQVGSLNRSFLWLTEEEAVEFNRELFGVIKKYAGERNAASHPEGTRGVACVVAVVPEV